MTSFPVNDVEFSIETRKTSPANLLMRIESFSLLSSNGIRQYQSREFSAGGYKWKIIFYPDGNDDDEREERDHISVSLLASGTRSLPVNWEINAIFTFCLYNQITDKYLCFRGLSKRFNAVNLTWGFSKLISTKIFADPSNGYLVNDNCVFGAEVFVIKRQRVNECLSLSPMVKHVFTIPSFSKYVEHAGYNSQQFKVGNHNWSVKVYPKGKYVYQNVERYVSIYLKCVDAKSFGSHTKVKADVKIMIRNNLSDAHHSKNFTHWYTCKDKSGQGFPWFMKYGEMVKGGFLVDDCCSFEIEISNVQAVVRDQPQKIVSLWSRLFRYFN